MTSLRKFELTLCLVVLFFSGPLLIAQTSGTTPPSQQEKATVDTGWPRVAKSGNLTVTLYQPQLQTWDEYKLKAYGAVLIEAAGAESPTYGVYWFTAKTDVDKGARRVDFNDLEITKVSFPTAPDNAAGYQLALQEVMPSTSRSLSLDRLEADLSTLQTDSKRSNAVLDNTPPHIIISNKPAVLVYIDGDPSWREVEGTKYQQLINTTVLLLKAPSGVHFLHLFDGWLQALDLEGPWKVARTFPVELAQAEQQVLATRRVDLLTGKSESPQKAPSLAAGPVPEIYPATSPTSLVVIDGEPDYKRISGTDLFYVANTTGQILVDDTNQHLYALLAGRWFRAATSKGPWTYVPSASLPTDFANIPDDSPKENVKASVSGTAQAREAVIANSIPQTAKVDRSTARMTPPQYDGEPQLKPIESTSLKYVVNSSVPVIVTTSNYYYAVENGVWFQASSLDGPWSVASSVPAEIYSIPPSSPLYYVTFVVVFEADSDFVHVGYLPGYYGVYADGDTIVYGTGYVYTAWIGNHWYGPAVTYGLGSNLTFTPLDRLGGRLWFWWRAGVGCLSLVGPGRVALSPRPRGRLGGRRSGTLGGNHRQCLPPVGRCPGRQPGLERPARLERRTLGGGHRQVLQLPHRSAGRRTPSGCRQRLSRQSRLCRRHYRSQGGHHQQGRGHHRYRRAPIRHRYERCEGRQQYLRRPGRRHLQVRRRRQVEADGCHRQLGSRPE